uniref:Uncharacterized protein n=1 Tax=uncultured Flavobacteriia bacterium TaxID=212695 RepID=H6REY9_9BACT|nr:hypothetical protein [uncultured bacterium]CCF99600.1 conserved hypothetical protein, membrane [uncultured Flavobacteriia bacterium]
MFFIPGFIYLKSYRLLIADNKTDFSKDWFEAIGISIINFILFSYPIHLISDENFIENNSFLYFLFFGSIILLAPILLAFLFYKISRTVWFSKFLINPTKSSWDSFFSMKESYYVIVTLKNSTKIAGKYGLNSYSSAFPHPNEIYLEEIYELNKQGGFGEKINQTEGVLITEGEISTIEFYK